MTADATAAYPPELRHSTQHAGRVYRLADDGFVAAAAQLPPTMPVELRLQADDGRELQVVRCAPGSLPQGAQRVYRDAATGQWRVPSGRVFIRFAPDVAALSQRAALQQAGYRIQSLPGYAPQAAWLEAEAGGIAQALSGIAALEALPGVENVEPQWLEPRRGR